MAKANKMRRKSGVIPCTLSSCCSKFSKDVHQKIHPTALEKKEWKAATCSVCMEHPHNAVLLLCSSYDKGCRPYMCATSYHHSNCLDQYKKAYTKVTSNNSEQSWHDAIDDDLSYSSGFTCPHEKMEVPELLCPLCRGKVKGWTVVEPARKYLNHKKRACMQDNCSFVGSYKELRKHVRAQHPWARPREVDPSLAEKWKKLENERELNDVMSTIRSTTPGAIVIGDYVIERNYRGISQDYDVDEYLDDTFYSMESFDRGMDDPGYSHGIFYGGYDSWDEEDFGIPHGNNAPTSGQIPRITHNLNRLVFGRSRRRQRHRSVNIGR